MPNLMTYKETEAILRSALRQSIHSVREISQATGIKVNTLYKWVSGGSHLSPSKADTLLSFFTQFEPNLLTNT